MKKHIEVLRAKLDCSSDEKLATVLGTTRQSITTIKSEGVVRNKAGRTVENLFSLTSILFKHLPKGKIALVMKDFEKVKRG